MASYETIGAIVFLVFLTLYFALSKKSLDIKSYKNYGFLAMRRTKLGLKLMDSLSRLGKFWKFYGYLGIVTGFLGMIAMVFFFGYGIYKTFYEPSAESTIAVVLPVETNIPGVFGIPFSYWIISIFIIVIVHEFSHGLVARTYNIRVKSTGFAFVGVGLRIISYSILFFAALNKYKEFNIAKSFTLNFLDYLTPEFWLLAGLLLLILSYAFELWIPLIPAAFVEPDEKILRKRPIKEQLSVFAAGPMANFALAGFMILVAYLVISPLASKISEPNGLIVSNYSEGDVDYPIERSGIKLGERITGIDNRIISDRDDLTEALNSRKPGNFIELRTNVSSYKLQLAAKPENPQKAYLGAYFLQSIKIDKEFEINYGRFLPLIAWLLGLYGMVINLNIGIGMFNLLPLGPLDGGRMIFCILQNKFKKEKANMIFARISLALFLVVIFFMIIILKNILFSFF